MIPRQVLDHLQQQAGLRSRSDEREDEPSIGQMRLQVEVQVHVGIPNGAHSLDVIQPEALGNLTKVGRWHRVEKPRHHLLDRCRLLLGKLVDLVCIYFCAFMCVFVISK